MEEWVAKKETIRKGCSETDAKKWMLRKGC